MAQGAHFKAINQTFCMHCAECLVNNFSDPFKAPIDKESFLGQKPTNDQNKPIISFHWASEASYTEFVRPGKPEK